MEPTDQTADGTAGSELACITDEHVQHLACCTLTATLCAMQYCKLKRHKLRELMAPWDNDKLSSLLPQKCSM